MSFQEKRAWVYLVITLGLPATYLAIIAGRLADTPAAEVEYVHTLIVTIAAAIVLDVLGNAAAALFAPREAGRSDERDRAIARFGARVEYRALVVGIVGALGLTMAQCQHFWIAHAIYLAFVLSSIAGAVARLAAYRGSQQPW